MALAPEWCLNRGRDPGWSCTDWLSPALASPLGAPSTEPHRDPAWVQLGRTRAAIPAEGARWLEMPVGRCGHRDSGLQFATHLLVGGGGTVAGAPSVCVCGGGGGHIAFT